MPLSRFITDLDGLLGAFHGNQAPTLRTFENLRVAVTRMNEIRRQLAIAEDKLGASLSLAENDLLDGVGADVVPADGFADAERFRIYDFCKTGIAEIDAEHSMLIEIGNRLYALSFCQDVSAVQLNELLGELIAYAQSHFSAEERLMAESHYPGLEAHRAVHQRMYDYLVEMFDLAKETPLLVAIRLEMFLGSWFVWHMQRDDAEFAQHRLGASLH